MAKDHYVPRVYLKGFVDRRIGNRLHCYRKSDLKYFQAHPKDVLSRPFGNTLKYSTDLNELEKLASWIEPSVDRIRAEFHKKQVTDEGRMRLSFLLAYLTVASPTFERASRPMLEGLLKKFATEADERGLLPKFPQSSDPEYSNKSLSSLLASGKIRRDFDTDVSRTFAMRSIPEIARKIMNGRWSILEAPIGSRFLTSDFPATFTDPPFIRIRRRLLPLDTRLALEIKAADLDHESTLPTSCTYYYCDAEEVRRLNRLMILGAEDLIISSQRSSEIESWVMEMHESKTQFSL